MPAEGGPSLDQQMALAKEQTKMFKAAKKAGGPLGMLAGVLQDIGLIEPLIDFVSILTDAIGAGLGDTIQQLSEALFTPENIELMQVLGELVAELVILGLVPIMAILQEVLPLIVELLPYIKIGIGYIKMGTTALKTLITWIVDFLELIF